MRVVVLISLYLMSYVVSAVEPVPIFQVPFEQGKSYLVVQGFFGDKTHSSNLDRYAIDLAMPVGDRVCAADEGEVIGYFNASKSYARANYVYILHKNGLITDYHHLKAGAKVSLGQKIAKGECFAESGNTGFSSGAHLHFAVLKMRENGDDAYSIPFKIIQPDGVVTPESFAWLEH